MATSFFNRKELEKRASFFDDDSAGSGSAAHSGSDDEEVLSAPVPPPAPKAAATPKRAPAAAAAADDSPAPAAKKRAVTATTARKKTTGKQFDWRVTIATPQTFKTSVTIMSRILSQCSFQVIHTPGFTGLRVDSIDSSHVCMIKASYECEIESNVELKQEVWCPETKKTVIKQEMFCIDTKMFNTLLKDVQPNHILTLTRFTDEDDLTLDSFARDDSSNRFTCTLNILDDDPRVPRMQAITYEFMVEMDLARLKSYCKMAQELNSSHMEFKILEPPADLESDSGERHLFFVVGATGDGGGAFQRIFHSAITVEPAETNASAADEEETAAAQGGKAHVTIRAVSCGDFGGTTSNAAGADIDFAAVQHSFTTKYAEVFSTSYLNLVLKSMDRQTVQLFMSKSLPLVVRYGLGNDFSHVKVILAPRVRDE